MNITASIVLYHSNSTSILALVKDLLKQGVEHVYLVDNSALNNQAAYSTNGQIEYLHNPSNPGFGAAHNLAMELAQKAQSKYHFVVNPDIQLGEDVIHSMVNFMSKDLKIGMMMPQILNLDGSIQFLPKLFPSPLSILKRKFKFPFLSQQAFVNTYELRISPSSQIYQGPIISGCFALLNLTAVREVGCFDESFFMYFEDFDLSRRMNKSYKTVYYPLAYVIHGYDSGANKSFTLLGHFVKSSIQYFTKWGWFIDKERDQLNQQTLSQFQK